MKNSILKRNILIISLCIALLMFISFGENHVAASEQVVADAYEFKYNINFNEKFVAIDLEINFDYNDLFVIESLTNKLEYNFIDAGKMVIVYFDDTGIGTDNITLRFKTNRSPEEINENMFNIIDINAYSLQKNVGYTNNEINMKYTIEDIKMLENLNMQRTMFNDKEILSVNNDNNSSSFNLYIYVFVMIIFIFIIISLIIIIKSKRIRGITLIVLGLLCVGTINDVDAVNELYIKKYENIKNYNNIIIVIPKNVNKNVKREEFEQVIERILKVKDIVNSKANNSNLIGTGSQVITEEKTYDVVVYGDINGDGKINANDMGLIIGEKNSEITNKTVNTNEFNNFENVITEVKDEKINGLYRKAANVNNLNDNDDKFLNSADIVRLKDYILCKSNINLVDELPEEEIELLSLNFTDLVLDLNEVHDVNLKTIITPISASNNKIKWESSDINVATVDDYGKVIGLSSGSVEIAAIAGNGKKAICTVTVQEEMINDNLNDDFFETDLNTNIIDSNVINYDMENFNNNVLKNNNINEFVMNYETGQNTSISINNNEQKINKETEKSSEEIKTLDNEEEVIDLDKNIINGSVETNDSKENLINETATISSIVSGIRPTRVNLNQNEVLLDITGVNTAKLEAIITPVYATNRNLVWGSSDSNIVQVDNYGNIVGVSNGNAEIIVGTMNGKRAVCNVIVQTTSTGIHFDTEYLTVKKGESAFVKPMLEPSTANIEPEITYSIISGNPKVAKIDEKTGEIFGMQAGVVEVLAKTKDNKEAKIKVNVKIGNKLFNTSVLSDKNNIHENILYSNKVILGDTIKNNENVLYMQSFDINTDDSIFYGSINGEKQQVGDKILGSRYSYISNSLRNNENMDFNSNMVLEYFGHMSAIDMEMINDDRYIWITGVATSNTLQGYQGNVVVSRIKYTAGVNYKYAIGKVKESDEKGNEIIYENGTDNKECNFVFKEDNGNLLKNIYASIDEDNRLIAIYEWGGKKVYIYDLDEALSLNEEIYSVKVSTEDGDKNIEFKAKNLNDLERLTTISGIDDGAIGNGGNNKENDILSYVMQGFDLDGDYIYIAEGTDKGYVTVLDYMYAYNGNVPALPKTEVMAVSNLISKSKSLLNKMGISKAEPEGIKVDSSGENAIMYLGFICGEKTSILKYED